jgi:hypothetical protein
MWASFDGLLAYGALAVVLAALFLPCYVRLGIGKGLAAFGALAIALLAATASLAQLTAAATSAATGGSGSASPLALPVQHAVGLLRGALGVPGSLVLVGGCAAFIFWMSMRLATRFYEQREF